MKTKLLSMVAAGAFLAMAGVASAQGPVTLNETQMDTVTAGGLGLVAGSGFAYAGPSLATALGMVTSSTYTLDTAQVAVVGVVNTPDGDTVIYVGAQSSSHSESTGL